MTYEIKELLLSDLEFLIEKYMDYYNNENGNWTYELARKRLESIFLTPDFYGIAIYEGSKMLGFLVGWFKEFDDIKLYYLEEILIFKENQNKGYGGKLLKELEVRIKGKDAEKISLLTTYEENHQKFYRRLGYEKSDFLIPMNKSI